MIAWWWVFLFLAIGALIGWQTRGIKADRDESRIYWEARGGCGNDMWMSTDWSSTREDTTS